MISMWSAVSDLDYYRTREEEDMELEYDDMDAAAADWDREQWAEARYQREMHEDSNVEPLEEQPAQKPIGREPRYGEQLNLFEEVA